LAAFQGLNEVACVLEKRIDLDIEVSVVLCRTHDGVTTPFPMAENVHVNGILDLSTVPAAVSDSVTETVLDQAVRLANGIDYVGVLGVEFFIAKDGTVYFNEMAPRPHNSGHYTLDATATCQFEQQVRMVCGLPAGDAQLLSPVTMLNLLGDAWIPTDPNWTKVLSFESAHLHLYGKSESRPGRKMGHINCLAATATESLRLAESIRAAL